MKTLVCLALVFVGAVVCPAAPVTQLKVMSFNIWVQGGLSLSNCIEVIRSSGADIVGLQECNATTAQTIATRLGFHVQPDASYAIVSRYPVVGSIPTSGGRGATLQLAPGQRVHLFDTHLTAYPYGPYDLKNGRTQSFIINQENQTRMPALTNLLRAMAPYLASAEPCFLVGDFNAPSHHDYAAFPWPTSLACVNAGLVDSYRELHPGNRKYPGPFTYNEAGVTWTPKTAEEPEGVFDRIDFVHYSAGDGTTPLASAELDERNSINPWPSDHRAVLTTFSLTPPVLGEKASAPTPAHSATRVPVNVTLSWLPGSNATSQAIYLGTSSPGALYTNTSATSVPLSNLAGATTYFWRVDTLTLSGTVTGEVWSFTTRGTNVAVYEWNFHNGDLSPALGNGVFEYADGAVTAGLTTFGTTDSTSVPHISGQPARYLRAPAFASQANGYRVSFTDSAPNGGGAYLNQYTMIFDVLLPGALNWFPFFNTNPQNANDADFYVSPDGALGIGGIGYSATGLIAPNTWHRIAFAADLAAGVVSYYHNGSPIFTGAAGLDGRHSIFSGVDSGPDLLLFNEGDTSGVYTHAVLLSSFLFTPRRMSEAEILALGGPKARGILVTAPPIRASIALQGMSVQLSWTGGEFPYQVQKTGALANPSWKDVGPPTNGTSVLLPHTGAAGYFRVVGL